MLPSNTIALRKLQIENYKLYSPVETTNPERNFNNFTIASLNHKKKKKCAEIICYVI